MPAIPSQLVQHIYNAALEHGAFLDLFEQLLSHDGDDAELQTLLQQSATIGQRLHTLQQQKVTAETIVERLQTGVVILNAAAEPLFINACARQALADRDAPDVVEPGQ